MADYAENLGYPRENWTTKSATRQLICAWDDRDEVIDEIKDVAYPYAVGGGSEGTNIQWQDSIPQNITVEPIPARISADSGDETVADYEKAIITIEYAPNGGGNGQVVNGNIMLENFNYTQEFLTLDNFTYYWGPTSETGDIYRPITEQAAPAKVLVSGELITQYFGLEDYPIWDIAKVNHINNAEYKTKTDIMNNLTFPAGTLLWQPGATEVYLNQNGQRRINYTIKMLYKPNGWNNFWNGAANAWEPIYYRDLDGEYQEATIFQSIDFDA